MKKGKKTGIIIFSVLIALTLAFIWGNSAVSKNASAAGSSRVYNALKGALDFIFGEGVITHSVFRKLAHGGEFMLLGLEICALRLFLGGAGIRGFAALLPYGLFVAVADESIQILSERGSSVTDVLIDYCGYLTALLIFCAVYFTSAAIKKRKKRTEAD